MRVKCISNEIDDIIIKCVTNLGVGIGLPMFTPS